MFMAFVIGCTDDGTSMGADGDTQAGLDGGAITCPTVVTPGISVYVIDQATGQPAACGATVILDSAAEVLTIEQPNGFTVDPITNATTCDDEAPFEGGNFEGIYKVTVQKPGYIDFVQENVVVGSNVCGLDTVTVNANIQ